MHNLAAASINISVVAVVAVLESLQTSLHNSLSQTQMFAPGHFDSSLLQGLINELPPHPLKTPSMP